MIWPTAFSCSDALREPVQAILQSTPVSEYPDVPTSKVHWASPVDIGPWWPSSLWSLVCIVLLPLQIIFPTSDLCVMMFCLPKSFDCHQIFKLQKLGRHRWSAWLQINFLCSQSALVCFEPCQFHLKNWNRQQGLSPIRTFAVWKHRQLGANHQAPFVATVSDSPFSFFLKALSFSCGCSSLPLPYCNYPCCLGEA